MFKRTLICIDFITHLLRLLLFYQMQRAIIARFSRENRLFDLIT